MNETIEYMDIVELFLKASAPSLGQCMARESIWQSDPNKKHSLQSGT